MIKSQRWGAILSLMVIVMIAYVDRVNIAVLVVDPGFLAHFGLQGDRASQGALMTVFLVGYGLAALLLTPFYEARLGYRRGLLLSLFIWALLTAVAPLMGSLFALLVIRALLGASEGPLFSLKTMVVHDHFAAAERGKPNAVSSMGVSLGLAVGFPLISTVVHSLGWAASFPLLAVLNLLLGVPLVWLYIKAPPPAASARPAAGPLLRQALRMKHLGAILLIEIFTLAYLWGSSSWLPAYLVSDKGFSLKAMGWISGLPFIVSLLANFAGGALADRLPPRLTCLVFVAGGLGCATSVLLLIGSQGTASTLTFLLCASLCWGLQGASIPTLVQRHALPGSVGSAYGLINGVGNMLAAFMPAAMGGLMQHTVSAGFALLIVSQVCVAVCGGWMVFVSGRVPVGGRS